MIWIALALLLVGLAFTVVLMLNDENKKTADDIRVEADNDATPVLIKQYLEKNGVELPAVVTFTALAVAAVAMLLAVLILPLNLALIVALAIPAMLVLTVKTIGSHRRAKMLEQLPSFINQVTRRLSAGISVENAFADSVETLERPLGTVMRRMVRRVYLGDELHRAFDREAKNSQLHEFGVLATALRINEQYGGSIRSILDDIVSILRLEDASKRELSAMTGETRFTAVVLALIPPATVAFMFWRAPNMLLDMWADPSGQMALVGAAAMEVTGALVLWRMIKSIGN